MLLALDVAFAHTGYILFGKGEVAKRAGVIVTEKSTNRLLRSSEDFVIRCSALTEALEEIINWGGCDGIIAEIPTGGSKSSQAAHKMGGAVAVLAALTTIYKLPLENVSPNEVKIAVAGKRSASKTEIMRAVREHYEWEVIAKARGKKVFEQIKIPCEDKIFGTDEFEHIADAAGAYWASRRNLLVRTFG